jgi:hypothetical protein
MRRRSHRLLNDASRPDLPSTIRARHLQRTRASGRRLPSRSRSLPRSSSQETAKSFGPQLPPCGIERQTMQQTSYAPARRLSDTTSHAPASHRLRRTTAPEDPLDKDQMDSSPHRDRTLYSEYLSYMTLAGRTRLPSKVSYATVVRVGHHVCVYVRACGAQYPSTTLREL